MSVGTVSLRLVVALVLVLKVVGSSVFSGSYSDSYLVMGVVLTSEVVTSVEVAMVLLG